MSPRQAVHSPDPQPVRDTLQLLLVRGVRWAQGGRVPSAGLDCYGVIKLAFALEHIALPETPEEAEALFTPVSPPYQPWDVLVFRLGGPLAPRHLGLLMAPDWGFHCGDITNGLSRFTLEHRRFWRRQLSRALRYQEWC